MSHKLSTSYNLKVQKLWQSKSQGQNSTHEQARNLKVVKPFTVWPRAKLNEKAKVTVCTMLPTTVLDGTAKSPHNDSHNDGSLSYQKSSFDSSQNGKTQAPTNVKYVQKASTGAKQIKYLEHQIKEAPVNVLDPKPRHSNHMRKVIAKAAISSSGNKLETNDDIPVPMHNHNSAVRLASKTRITYQNKS
jgi:hypothetical protein